VLNIIKRVCLLAEFVDDRLVDRPIPLDAEALRDFAQFAQYGSGEKNAFEGREREWYAKATAHVLRLAATLTLMEWALTTETEKPGTITAETMKAAIKLVQDYFWPHARACLRQLGLSERHAHARSALKWIRVRKVMEVSREDVRRDALAQKLDASQTDELLVGLCNSGWIREKISQEPLGRGKPARRWEVNPMLHNTPHCRVAENAENGTEGEQ
jgi:hypothetical protein